MNASDARTEYVAVVRQLAAQAKAERRPRDEALLLALAQAVEEGRLLDATTAYYDLPLRLYERVGKAPPTDK